MHDRFSSVPDLLLERYALGELTSAEKRGVEERLAADPALQQRLADLRASDSALRHAHPPEVLARRLQDRLRRERVESEIRTAEGKVVSARRMRTSLGFGVRPALGGILVLALVAVPAWKVLQENRMIGTEVQGIPGVTGTQTPDPQSSPNPSTQASSGSVETGRTEITGGNPAEGMSENVVENPDNPASEQGSELTRLKGIDPRLALFRKTDQGAVPVRPGETASPGEFLRIGYHAAGFDFGAIFSVDGNGNVTRHWPVKGNKAVRLKSGEALLPNAFELDAAPAFERFYLVVAEHPFALEPLLAPLHAGTDSVHALPLPPEARIVRFEILKESGI
jgi:hypothetical protein